MSAAAFPSETSVDLRVPGTIRASGEIRAVFEKYPDRTGLARVFECGGLRLRCPRVGPTCEAVIINTAGGIAGGDTARLAFEISSGAQATLTTQSAEKIYRSQGPSADIDMTFRLASGARLNWLPQETILFNGANLDRSLDLELACDAQALLVESTTFGRLAMGETLSHGAFRDRWRIRRAGRLIFAEDIRLGGNMAERLDRSALGGGARMVATVLAIGADSEAQLAAAREALAFSPAQSGFSAWNGMLVGRILSASPEQVRAAIVALLACLGGGAVPRVWQ